MSIHKALYCMADFYSICIFPQNSKTVPQNLANEEIR